MLKRCVLLYSGPNIRSTLEQWSTQQLGNGSSYETLVAPEWLACVAELPWLQVRTALLAYRVRTCPSLTAGWPKTDVTVVPCRFLLSVLFGSFVSRRCGGHKPLQRLQQQLSNRMFKTHK